MENLTPYSALAGGILIGLAATVMLLFTGRIAGISGIMGGLLGTSKTDAFWRLAFLTGIILGAFIFHQIKPGFYLPRTNYPLSILALGGFLVGFGTRLGNGCTSGHAVCGISRFSIRSIIATITFMASGMVTVSVMRHLFGVSL